MYDAIVVGARCAGSPTAMLLARKGYRVLLVDSATFPSDTISTHLVWPSGIARLKRWELLDKVVASNCPVIRKLTFDLGPFALMGSPPPADGISEFFAPRRHVLDTILVNAAVEAGAELRENCFVEGVLFAALHGNQSETDRFFGMLAGTVPVPEFFSPENIQRVIGSAWP